MFGIVLSALFAALSWFVRSILVKFVVFFALFFVVTGFVAVMASALLPSGDAGLTSAFSGLSSGVWYFLDLFQVPVGVSLVLSASISRFVIRRIPVIG